MSHYQDIIIETFRSTGGGSTKSIRARPVSGQNLDTLMKVECSSSMRKNHPVGTLFLLKNREGGKPFLYAHFDTPYKIMTTNEANEFLKK
jgi:hypothetical protein